MKKIFQKLKSFMYLVGGKLHREELFQVTLKHNFDCTYLIGDPQIRYSSNNNKKLPPS